jgi:glutaredoxin
MKPLLALLASFVVVAMPAHAQYKIVGPDGSITFTDRVPDANQGRVSNVTKRGAEAPAAELPYDLRQVVQKFPVTVYTSSDCGPCREGLELLARRGVPFQERTASTQDDKAQWQKVTGTTQAPVLMVGKQRLESFDPTAWNEALSTAGYPTSSKLPINYRQAEAIPLAPRPAPKPAPPKPEPEVAVTPSGAGGIRF